MALKPKAKSVGIVLNRTEDSVSTFLLRVPKVHNIMNGATVEIVRSTDVAAERYRWSGTVTDVATQIVDPEKKASKVFDDKVLILQVTCEVGVDMEKTAKTKKGSKAKSLKDAGDVIVIDVTIANDGAPASEHLELPDIAGLIP